MCASSLLAHCFQRLRLAYIPLVNVFETAHCFAINVKILQRSAFFLGIDNISDDHHFIGVLHFYEYGHRKPPASGSVTRQRLTGENSPAKKEAGRSPPGVSEAKSEGEPRTQLNEA